MGKGNFRHVIMGLCRKWFIGIMAILAIFTLISCLEAKNTSSDEQDTMKVELSENNANTSEKQEEGLGDEVLSPDYNAYYSIDVPVSIENYEDIEIGVFLDSMLISKQENETIKRIIIDMILFMHGYEIKNDIFCLIDRGGSRVFLSKYIGFEEGRTMVDELQFHRDHNMELKYRLAAIDANFMQKLNFISEDGEEYLRVRTLVYQNYGIYENPAGVLRMNYDFYLKNFDGSYKFVGFFIDS